MLVVNLFGAPGAGKSTLAHLLTGLLKKCHVPCELASEYAKDVVLDRSPHFLTNQFRILGEQSWRVERIAASGAEVAVTDSPVALVAFFAKTLYPERYSSDFVELVMAAHREWPSFDFYLRRNHPYESRGRLQSETEASALADAMLSFVSDVGLSPLVLPSSDVVAERVFCELVASRRLAIPPLGIPSARRVAAFLLASPSCPEDVECACAALSVLVAPQSFELSPS